MATYTVNVKLGAKDVETGAPATTTVTHNLPFVAGTGNVIAPGDIVTFAVATKDAGVTSGTYSVTGIDTTLWTSASTTITISTTAVSLTARAAVAGTDSVVIDPSVTANPDKTLVIVIKTADRTPDTPSFPNITGANPSDSVESAHVKITGIDNGTPVSITGGGYIGSATGSKATTGTVNNGSYLNFGYDTPATFGTAKTMTLTIGTWTGTWTVTTRQIGDDVAYIAVPYAGTTVKLNDVIATFQDPTAAVQRNLKAYLRAPAGAFVPDLPVNAAVPTVLPIKLSQFIGAKNALYWVKKPQNREFSWNTVTDGAKTLIAGWGIGGDQYTTPWSLGFGTYLDTYADIRYVVTASAGVTVTVQGGGDPATWSKNNRWIKLSASGTAGREDTFNATVTIYVRHPLNTSVVLSAVVTASWFFWGV